MNQKGLGTAADWFLDTCKRNPEGLLLLGAGAVLLMRHGQRASATDGYLRGQSLPNNGSQTSDDAITSRAADYVQRASDVATDYAHQASEYTKNATSRVGERSSQLAQKAQTGIQKTFGQVLEEQPLAIALAGVATGAAIASLIPTSDFEKETIGPISSQVSQAAIEKLKSAATAAADSLKGAAEEHGLNAEGLKEVASDVADAVMSNGSEIAPQSASPTEGLKE